MSKTELQLNQLNIKGKIVEVEHYGEGDKKRYNHQVVLQSKDQYSTPAGIIVNSTRMMGAEGQEVETLVEYSGFVKRINYVAKDTGEKKSFKQLNARFIEVVQA